MNQRTHAAAVAMEEERLPDWKLAYRIPEAAAAAGMGESTLWKKISEGKLRAKKDGAVTVIKRQELQRYIDELPDVVPSRPAADVK
jgi:excisionase family DNA binding protein